MKVYRDVFQKEFDLGFHQPKKDICKDCVAFDGLSTVEKGLVQQDHDNHVSLKESCRKEKAIDKIRATKSDKAFHSVTFDLQQVLNTPTGNASSLYYKQKLATLCNLTFFDQVSHECTCYVWHEFEERRGSCEIETCIMRYLQGLPEEIKEVALFSDSCIGQNRYKMWLQLISCGAD